MVGEGIGSVVGWGWVIIANPSLNVRPSSRPQSLNITAGVHTKDQITRSHTETQTGAHTHSLTQILMERDNLSKFHHKQPDLHPHASIPRPTQQRSINDKIQTLSLQKRLLEKILFLFFGGGGGGGR